MKKLLFALFAIMMLSIVSFANGISEEKKTDVLEKKYGQIECRANFYVDILEESKKYTNVSVDAEIGVVKEKLAALKTAAESGKRQDFLSAMDALHEESKNVIALFNDAKKELIGKEGKENRKLLREFFVAGKQKMADCLRDANLEFAKSQAEYVKAWREKAGNLSDKLKEKGVDTNDVDSVLATVDSKISELEAAIATGDGDKAKEAEKSIRAQHLHLWARYHIARLGAILNAMEAVANEKGYGSDVNAIKTLLDEAGGMVKIGQPYNEGEFQKVWQDIKDAAVKLRELRKKLVGA